MCPVSSASVSGDIGVAQRCWYLATAVSSNSIPMPMPSLRWAPPSRICSRVSSVSRPQSVELQRWILGLQQPNRQHRETPTH